MTALSSEPRSPTVPGIGAPWREVLRDGTSVLIRPIQATDEKLEQAFIERLLLQPRSDVGFLGTIKTPSAALLKQFTHPQWVRGVEVNIAIIADPSETREIGVCRYSASPDG